MSSEKPVSHGDSPKATKPAARPRSGDLGEILKLTPAEIQAWLDQQLAGAPPEVQAAIRSVDYVEPGSVRSPKCNHYLEFGQYDGERDKIEIGFEIAEGIEAPIALALQLL